MDDEQPFQRMFHNHFLSWSKMVKSQMQYFQESITILDDAQSYPANVDDLSDNARVEYISKTKTS